MAVSYTSGSSDRKGKVFNPATGEQESEVRLANKLRFKYKLLRLQKKRLKLGR